MKNLIFALLIILLGCYHISLKNKINSEEIKGVTITDNFPLIVPETGKLLDYDTFVNKIFIYKNLKGYKLQYVFDSSVNNRWVSSEKRYNYLVHNAGDKIGYFFLKKDRYFKLPIDSVLKNYSFYYIDPYTLLTKKTESTLISSKSDADNNDLEEIYFLKKKEDTSHTSRAVLHFIKADTSPVFSFSREFERIKKMRLVRIDYFNNKQYFKDYNYTLDAIDEFNIIEGIKESDKSEILDYFKLYETIIANKKN